MPYSKLKDANPAIRGIKPPVTLAQANLIAKWADAMEAAEDGPDNPWAAAIAQFKKLYVTEDDKWMKREGKSLDTAFVAFGGAVKSLDGGHIGGYLVRFSDADSTDLTGDFFTAETDFGFSKTLTSPIYLNHTLPLTTRDGKNVAVTKAIGEVMLTIDEHGILTDAVLYNRELYQEMLDSLGWSSGTAAYLVQRESAGKAQHITRWPLGLDASLTPIPAEPRNMVVPFKSLLITPEAAIESETTPEGGGNPPAETETGATEAEIPSEMGQIAAIKAVLEIELTELEIMEV